MRRIFGIINSILNVKSLCLAIWLLGRLSDKESACQCRRCRRHRFSPQAGKIPWRRKWQPALVFLPGEFYGEEPGGLQFMGLQGSDTIQHSLSFCFSKIIKMPLWLYSYNILVFFNNVGKAVRMQVSQLEIQSD